MGLIINTIWHFIYGVKRSERPKYRDLRAIDTLSDQAPNNGKQYKYFFLNLPERGKRGGGLIGGV